MAEVPDDLPGYVCWDPGEVGRVINTEAAAPSIDVLLATHQKVPLERLSLAEAGSLQSTGFVEESTVLEAVTGKTDGALIVPIIGDSGSGKSHFVLWLHAQLMSGDVRQSWRRVVYIPKNDLYLANVIELILQKEEGEEFNELRKAVKEATTSLDVPTAAIRLRNAVAVAVAGLPTEGNEALEVIVEGLPALLSDPTYKDYLIGEGRAFAVTASAALGEADEEVQARFVDGDLPMVSADVQDDMAAESKEFLKLLGNRSLREATYEALNQVRDTAMSEVFGIKPNQLVRVIRRLREDLYERDPKTEIVLMIEDFTLLQGVQYELLEAMLELPYKDGKQVLCEMKAVVAVTSGRFSELVAKNDTLRTRLESQGHVYRIDLAVGEEGGGRLTEEQLISFLARYLNVARIGPGGVSAGGSVTNACASCDLEDQCHPVFKADVEEHGLYPLNPAFIENLAASHGGKINPREVLNSLRRVLVDEAEYLRHLRAPSESFLRHLEPSNPDLKNDVLLSPPVRNEISKADAATGERRIGVQTWWDREKDNVAELDPDLLAAFGLAPIEVSPGGWKGGTKRGRTRTDRIERSDGPTPIDEWLNGRQLPSTIARSIRQHIRASIVDIVGGVTLLVTEDELATLFQNDSIRIENSAGGGALSGNAHAEDFECSASNAVFFASVVASAGKGLAEVPASAVIDYTAELHRRSKSVGGALAERRSAWDDEMPGIARAVALYALAAGLAESGEVEGLLTGLARDATESRHEADMWFPRLAGSANAFKAFRSERGRVLGFATGAKSLERGDAISYDLAALLPPLEELSQNWQLHEADLSCINANLARSLRGLDKELDGAHSLLLNWHKRVTNLLGADSSDAAAAIDRVASAETAAVKVGVASSDLSFSTQTQADLPGMVEEVGCLLGDWDSIDLGQRISGVLALSRERLEEMREECDRVETGLDQALEAATKQARLGPNDDPLELAAGVEKSVECLRETAEAAREYAA